MRLKIIRDKAEANAAPVIPQIGIKIRFVIMVKTPKNTRNRC